ncbi:MFS transporter [Winogradskyella undariae]|uniref:MFS transporter n=1 Tax=Winogradskyella TaxID=286104 RepID=UPI00156B5C63|nr:MULTISPECIES: MFS transporter [Winogradskyella]NRR92109.1 MFS transporter [Winogradskyella undariae]QXP80286.1 MFS transporter [Winogradskyella sp. HaHa_3_26]
MKVKGLRWVIIGLIMLITIINYLDRGTLNYMWVANIEYDLVDEINVSLEENQAQYLAEDNTYRLISKRGEEIIQRADHITFKKEDPTIVVNRQGMAYELGIVDSDVSAEEASKQAKDQLGIITIFFMIAYGFSQLFSGKLYDKIGTRKGFVVSVLIWGTADALTSLARGKVSLTGFRMMLGLGEAGPWPGATKSNAEWFPQKERAFAQGLFGAAASIGSILAPIIILMLYMSIGWKMTFVVVGGLGILWLIPWLIINKKGPKEHSWITEEEREYILSGQPESKVTNEVGKTWGQLLSNKKNYSVILGRFFLDPIWWMFVTFLPMYLVEEFGLNIKELAFSAWIPYVGAMIGSIAGGWYSGFLIRKGATVDKARKTAMLLGGAIVIPAIIASVLVPNAVLAVVLMAFVLGGFQFMMTNIQTLPSDLHGGKSVGSLAGLGGAAAVLGTILAILFAGYITSWPLLFGLLGALVPLSLISIYLTVGKIERID